MRLKYVVVVTLPCSKRQKARHPHAGLGTLYALEPLWYNVPSILGITDSVVPLGCSGKRENMADVGSDGPFGPENTVVYWQNMMRHLLEEIQGALGAYGVDIQEELSNDDIDRIVKSVAARGDNEPLDNDFACNLANLGVCAVAIYRLQNT